MKVIPAIDIKGGECVRLIQGDYRTVYKVAENPIDTAKKFACSGAEYIHLVDLDGAKDGHPVNGDVFFEIAKLGLFTTEVGGGIRDLNTAEYYFSGGIDRVILGSSVIKDPKFVKTALREYKERIVIGIDAKNGYAAAEGWLDVSDIDYIELAIQMEKIGAKTIIFTDISTDGTMSGPNLTQLGALHSAVNCDIIASGGISSLKDIINLRKLDIFGAICGKALYSGALDLKMALTLAELIQND